MALENAELWQMIIKVFVNYAIKVTSDDSIEAERLYRKVIEYLKKIPEGTLQEKSCFIEVLQWKKEIPKEIVSIFQILISKSFGKNRNILDMLKNYLYVQLENAGWRMILQDMLSADINIFFFGLGLLLKAGNLSKLYSENEVSEVKLMFTNWQMIHLMKGTLYFAVKTKKR